MHDRSGSRAAIQYIRLCSPFGEKHYAVECDLTDDVAISRLHSDVLQTLGRLDTLVLCSGAIGHGKLEETSASMLDQQYAANVRGPLALIQKMLPLLKQPKGQVVVINSSSGLSTASGRGHFTATQHAPKALTDTLRQEVNGDNVRVLSVYPGRTATPRMVALYQREGRSYQPELLLQPEDVASVVINALTLPWTTEVTDISIRSMKKSY